LARQDQEFHYRLEVPRKLVGIIAGAPDLVQFVVSKDASAFGGAVWGQSKRRILADVATFKTPVKEDAGGDQRMVIGAAGFNPFERAGDFPVGDIRQLSFEAEAAEQPFVPICRTAATGALLFLDEELHCLLVGDALGPDLPQAHLRQLPDFL
jgi:hypothetical protein